MSFSTRYCFGDSGEILIALMLSVHEEICGSLISVSKLETLRIRKLNINEFNLFKEKIFNETFQKI